MAAIQTPQGQMNPNARVLQSIHTAIDDFNQVQPAEHHLDKSPETALLGSTTRLDSLGLVSFLVTVEQQLASDFGQPITLASDKAFSLRNSPFATLGTLTSYIEGLLEGSPNG